MLTVTRSRARGFTLVELVAVIVIVGAIVAVAVPVFRDLRYDARKAALQGIRTTLVANMNAARTAYLAQGLGAGSTVQVNGQAIEVWAEGATDDDGYMIPAGSPTPAGMFALLGCGTAPLASGIETTCATLPGKLVWGSSAYFVVWESAIAAHWGDTQCFTAYFPPFGYDDTLLLRVWSSDYATYYGSELYSMARSAGASGGC